MKRVKKFASLLLALVMVLAMSLTAFADNAADGSITIKNATVDKSYSIYKVFDLTYSTKDESTNVAYTYTKKAENDAFLAALQSDESPFTLTETPTAGKYTVVIKENKGAADISKFLTNQKDNLTAAATKTATTSEVKFTDLFYGYYFATSEVGTVLTIDSTLPNVEVIDKNQKPDWDNGDNKPGKVIIDANGNKVTENTVNYGDTVNFSVAVNATAYVGDKQTTYYYITDTLGAGFSAAQNIKVYVNDTEKTLTTDYTINPAENANGTHTFTITLPYAESYGANSVIEVKYSATVLNTALLAGSGNLNKANFTYDTKDPSTPVTPDPTPNPSFPSENEKNTTTYVYALGIVKVDPKGDVLKGAEFSVKDADDNDIWATGDNGVYEYCKAGAQGAVNQFKTDDNGVLVIKGVAAGTYSVTEQVAPQGYNLLNGSVNVEAELKEQYTTKVTTYLDENGNVTNTVTTNTKDYNTGVNVTGLVVVNNAGTELPSTGGMGTTIFYALGGLLVVCAAVLLVVKRRMKRNN